MFLKKVLLSNLSASPHWQTTTHGYMVVCIILNYLTKDKTSTIIMTIFMDISYPSVFVNAIIKNIIGSPIEAGLVG